MRTSTLVVSLLAVLTSCGGSTSEVDAALIDARAVDAPEDAGGVDAGCPDEDRDGHGVRPCGDDCDDSNASRYPGNTEVCDTDDVDEDCDPATVGPDADGDDQAAITCCNARADGTHVCGFDCDDTERNVHPGAPESCNGVDDNCNGLSDEGVLTSYYPDADGDGFGDAMMLPTLACTPPATFVTSHNDCDDVHTLVHPGATELCNAIDDDCNGVTDTDATPACMCTVGMMQVCGSSIGICRPGMRTCAGSTWGACGGAGYVGAHTSESCDHLDDNCDGLVDDISPLAASDVSFGPNWDSSLPSNHMWPNGAPSWSLFRFYQWGSSGYVPYTSVAGTYGGVFLAPTSASAAGAVWLVEQPDLSAAGRTTISGQVRVGTPLGGFRVFVRRNEGDGGGRVGPPSSFGLPGSWGWIFEVAGASHTLRILSVNSGGTTTIAGPTSLATALAGLYGFVITIDPTGTDRATLELAWADGGGGGTHGGSVTGTDSTTASYLLGTSASGPQRVDIGVGGGNDTSGSALELQYLSVSRSGACYPFTL